MATPETAQVNKAIEWENLAVTLNPDDSAVLNTLGVACCRRQRWNEAIANLKRAEVLERDACFAHNAFFVTMAQWQLGQHDDAHRSFAEAVVWMNAACQMPRNEFAIGPKHTCRLFRQRPLPAEAEIAAPAKFLDSVSE